MPKEGDFFVVQLKDTHVDWGEYRYTNTRDIIPGEGYIPIPRSKAEAFHIYNANGSDLLPLYDCSSIDGLYQGTLLAQGSSEKGGVYAKQFAEYKNLKGLGRWFTAMGAKPGDQVRVIFTSPTSLTIELL